MKILSCLIVISTILLQNANASTKIGVVGAANGKVTAVNSLKSSKQLKLGDSIFFKDTIKTDKNGNAQLLFIDKSALTVGANASIIIDEFVYNPADSSGNLLMRSTKGTFRFIGGALSKKKAVKIKTPVGTIGIRGGIAIIDINPTTGATDATFVYGEEMTFKNALGNIASVTDSGAAIALETATAKPEIIILTPEQVSHKISALEGQDGTNAGAKEIPQDADVEENLNHEIEGEDFADEPNDEKSHKGEDGKKSDRPQDKRDGEQQGNDKHSESDEQHPNEMHDDSEEGGEFVPNEEHEEGERDPDKQAFTDERTDPNDPKNDPNGEHNVPDGEFSDGERHDPQHFAGSDGEGGEFHDGDGGEHYSDNGDFHEGDGGEFYSGNDEFGENPEGFYEGDGGFYDPQGEFHEGDGFYNPDGTEDYAFDPDYLPPTSEIGEDGAIDKPTTFNRFGFFSFLNSTGTTASGKVEGDEHEIGDFFRLLLTRQEQNGSPNTGFEGNGVLPRPLTVGTHNFDTTIGINNEFFSGQLHASKNLDFYYYRMERKETTQGFGTANEQDVIIVGERVINIPTSGRQYFSFLPDIRSYHNAGSSDVGFFDYNTADQALSGSSSVSTDNKGMLVDWSSQQFITGNIDGNSLKLAYGKLDGSNGKVFEFDNSKLTLGNINIQPDNIYGNNANGTVDAISAAGSIGSTGIETPAVISDDVFSGSYNSSAAATGFMAGFVESKPNSGSTGTFSTYLNTGHNDLTFSRSGGEVSGATINLEELGAGTDDFKARFGSDALGSDPVAGADTFVIDESLYALQQGGLDIVSTQQTNTMNGVLVSGDAISDTIMQCADCEYVHWGVWAAEIPTNSSTIDIAHLIPYIAGDITPSLGGLNVNATYSGPVFGSISDGSSIAHHAGDFTAAITISGSSATIAATGLSGNINAINFTNQNTINFSGSAFSGAVLDAGGGTSNGTINGALFGLAAENVGGNFEFTDGSNSVNGVYMGAK